VAGIIFVFLFLGGLLVTVYYTWRRKWPAWSASWYGYAALIVFIFAILPTQAWNPPLDRLFGGGGTLILVLLSLATLAYWLTRRNPIEGLLMALPLIILYWLPITEFIPNAIRMWLMFALFMLSALAAMSILRTNDIRRAVWIVLGASLLGGAPIAYARTFWNNIPPEHSLPGSPGQMLELFSVQFLAGAALAIGPVLGWGLWNLGRKYGKAGRLSALLMIFGMVINLIGHFSHWWSFSRQTYLNALQISALYRPDQAFSVFMVAAGLVAIFAGAVCLAIPWWRQNKLLSMALILAPLALPLVAMFSTYFGYYIVPVGFTFEFAMLSEIHKNLIFLIGIAWLLMSGWTVTRLYQVPSSIEGAA